MNKTLAQAMTEAITNPAYEKAKGYCQRLVRQVLEHVYGTKYASFMASNAKATGDNFAHAGLGLSPAAAAPLQEGDILFKRHIIQSDGKEFPFGHVGVYVGNGKVGENSSTSIGRVQGAKGYRTLDEFGHFDLVVRLPDPHAAAAVPPKPAAQPEAGHLAATLNGVKVYDKSGTELFAQVGIKTTAEWQDGRLIVRLG